MAAVYPAGPEPTMIRSRTGVLMVSFQTADMAATTELPDEAWLRLLTFRAVVQRT
ncbi:hypothetical protein GCM10011591_27960 [Nocardia camponoti]|uniref:Uncharacterized protein n=1 Tax=Nocardia camponoti TaxID=1616106 RepID=A0A917QL87_9NOCA|nr:hypothetical protein GCM10011591_27960 [Nocardia camponoti]